MNIQASLLDVHDLLHKTISLEGWPQGNWPLRGDFRPPEFEIAVGAVLTQNTRWRNVEQALANMEEEEVTSASSIFRSPTTRLEEIIQPAGFFRKKSRLLKQIAAMILNHPTDFYSSVTRGELLSIVGIGPETADAILLYACSKPEFVADSYSRRILNRLGFGAGEGYREVKRFVESHLPAEVWLYRRFHALLVEHAKISCRKVPRCSDCVLQNSCSFPRRG